MSNYLHTVPAGTRLKSIGPLGRFIMPEPVQNDVVFVATGTGVAPFLSMIGHMYSMRYDVGIEVVFGVRYVYDLIYRKELEAWERTHKNFRFYPTVSRPETPEWRGRVGYVQKILQNEIQHKGRKDVYICGLHDMVEQVTQLCREEGFRTVRFEKWD